LSAAGPPQQVIIHRLCGRIELRQSGIDVAAPEMRPQRRDRDVDGMPDRCKLTLDRRFASLARNSVLGLDIQ
jgi:hypothetical protein